jgi:predicted DNA-binding antitoxin AbrB/MazE fold protein
VFKPLEKVDFPESAKMMIRIEPVKPKGLLKLAEELEKKQKEERKIKTKGIIAILVFNYLLSILF